MIADLHTHSNASDGQYPPARVAAMARERGIALIALTDHDTMDGTAEAAAAGARLGLQVLRGIELSAREHKSFHILGYGCDPASPRLSRLCQDMRSSRAQRKYRIADYLRAHGVDINLAEVEALAGGGVIARPHFARIMVARGYVGDVQEAFDRYLDTRECQRIGRFKPPAADCIRAIREAGGHAALAHPYQTQLSDDRLTEALAELKECGLEGIECHYPRHTPAQTAFYLALARRFGLHVTGGSDFHGEQVKPDISLSALELDVAWLLG